MCYHIVSLVRHGWTVYVAGHFDTQLPRYLCTPQVHRVPLWSPPSFFSKLPRAIFVLVAAVKVPMQTLSLWLALVARTPKPAVVLVQTPPAIPTLMVVQCACLLTRSRLFLDWHNLAYTLLALRLGPHSPLVRVSETLERLFGRHADAHLFVTQAMLRHLAKRCTCTEPWLSCTIGHPRTFTACLRQMQRRFSIVWGPCSAQATGEARRSPSRAPAGPPMKTCIFYWKLHPCTRSVPVPCRYGAS